MRYLSVMRGLRRVGILLLLVALTLGANQMTVAALTKEDLKDITAGRPAFDPTAESNCGNGASASTATSSTLPTGAGSTLEGHVLPATSGHVGIEERAVRVGDSAVLAPGTSDPGAHLALSVRGLTDKDVQFYFNMRWRFAVWSWSGGSRTGPEDRNWYTSAVRKVLVTNPKNNTSVVTAIVESGPAPWTGTNMSGSNPPPYWQGYVDGTPAGYTGRVSGVAPDAFHAIGATEDQSLNYAWAPDQHIDSGTVIKNGTVVSGGGTSNGTATACSNAGQSTAPSGSFIFYSQYDKRWVGHCYGNPQDSCATTLGPSGCGPTSMAMVVANLKDSSVTPIQTADYGTSIGSYQSGTGTLWSYMIDAPKHWGLKSRSIGVDLDQAITAMKGGALVIASGTGVNPFTPSGHLLVLRGVAADGNILMGDPNLASNNTKEWTKTQLLTAGLRQLWVITK